MGLVIQSLTKRFGAFTALNNLGLEVATGELLALLGPSGSGKTTLLRILAGLQRADEGRVQFEGRDFLTLPAVRRKVGLVFQHYALFPHMTVAENVAFGLTVGRGPVGLAGEVARLLDLVQLGGLEARYPSQLSGGQQQRVALARAMATGPQLLLLDEPFGALDAQVRRDLRQALLRLHEATRVTTIFVTHDQAEAMELADRLAILDQGHVVQAGDPQTVYAQPANAYVYGFLGDHCELRGEVAAGRLKIGDWETPAPLVAEGLASVLVRPHQMAINPSGGPGISAVLERSVTRGATCQLVFRVAEQTLNLEVSPWQMPAALAAGSVFKLLPQSWKIYRP